MIKKDYSVQDEEDKPKDYDTAKQGKNIGKKCSNTLPADLKLLFVDSLEIEHFVEYFGPGEKRRYTIKDIKFSDNGKFCFICKTYTGKSK